MNKNVIIAILSTIVAVFVVLVILGLVFQETERTEPIKSFDTTQTPNYAGPYFDELGDEYRAEFMTGCVDGRGEWIDFCGCAYDYLDQAYSNEVFWMIIDDINEYGDAPEMYDAIDRCNYLAPDYIPTSVR